MIIKMLVLTAMSLFAVLMVAQSNTPQKPDNSKPTPVNGYQKTPSGLEYHDIMVGTGKEAHRGDRVRVHYTGWLTNGQKFDSSVDRGQPFMFQIGQGVIQGWSEGVQGMKVGGKRQLRIPADLAYGSRGIGPIPPNSTLIFDIELLSVM